MTFLFGTSSVTMIIAAPFVGCFGAHAVQRSLGGKDILYERSCCDACGRRLELRDLVPPLSWLLQGGRCRACSAPIPLLYPAVEAGFLLIALWAAHAQRDLLVPSLLLGCVLLILIAFDMLAFILPNVLTLPLGVGGLLLAASEGEFQESALGLVAGGASLLLVRVVYGATRGREGLGLGDVKLFAAAGAWVKPEGLPSVLLIGASLGLLYALFACRGALRDAALKKVPLGAGLCIGFWLTWVYGPVFEWPLGAIFSPGTSS
jgi:leader peptidase (prepilin peptidase) / N-methyltransferase